MSFFPLDRDLLTSTLWTGASPTQLKVWLYLLLTANPRNGTVTHTTPAIAQRCGLPVAKVEEALEWLESPDPYSRTPDDEGRRISRSADGIQILTYEKHRDRDHSTARVQRYRERKKAAKRETDGNGVSPFHVTPETTDKDKDKDKDRSINNPNPKSKSKSSSSSSKNDDALTLPLASRDRTDLAVDVARRYIAVRDAVQSGRTRQLSPDVVDRVKQRLRQWKPWQIVALPILVNAQGRRDKYSPDVLLRDGSSPRTRNGNTFGAYYWLARTYEKADGTRLDERLTAIANQAGVREQLQAIGVLMDGDTP